MSTRIRDILANYGRTSTLEESCGARKRLEGLQVAEGVYRIPLDKIVPDPEQPRKEFDNLELYGLAKSMKTKGQLQPVIVRWDEELGKYVLVAGERRWRAAALAGLVELIATVDDTNKLRLETQLIENLQRSDLSPLDEARAFDELLKLRGWTYRDLAETLGISESKVSRSVALLDLPEEAQAKVEAGELMGQAVRELVVELNAAKAVAAGKPTKRKSKPKPTVKTFKTAAGAKVTVAFTKKVDEALVEQSLAQALEQVRGTPAATEATLAAA